MANPKVKTRILQQLVSINPQLTTLTYPLAQARANMFLEVARGLRANKILVLKYTQKRLNQEEYERVTLDPKVAPWHKDLMFMLLTLEVTEEDINEHSA